jgi:hypothetical protein
MKYEFAVYDGVYREVAGQSRNLFEPEFTVNHPFVLLFSPIKYAKIKNEFPHI